MLDKYFPIKPQAQTINVNRILGQRLLLASLGGPSDLSTFKEEIKAKASSQTSM